MLRRHGEPRTAGPLLMRCFVALALAGDVRDRVAAIAGAVRERAAGADVRWVVPENLHLTLKFLGRIDASRVADVARALSTEARRHRVGELAVGGVGAFPSTRRPRVVWIGMEDVSGGLGRLAAGIDEALAAALGLPRQERPFAGHVTLARVRSPRGASRLGGAIEAHRLAQAGRYQPDAVTLFESVTGRAGATYRVEAVFPLAE